MLGFIGAPLLVTSSLATMFGGHGQVSDTATLFALPIAAWELSLGVYLAFKGFQRSTPSDAPVAAPALAA
jgi:peptidoglycan/LPS O-acetylase OafA/YrhL